jgi:hypothetical protein
MKVWIFAVLALFLFSCSLAPKIQPVTFNELVGTYRNSSPQGKIDILVLDADSTYVRQFHSSSGEPFVDRGKWYLHLLGSRQNSPYVKIQLDHFVTRFVEDSTGGNSPLDPVPGGVADSVAYPREARIWKSVQGSQVTIRLGQTLTGPAWVRVDSK